MEPNEQKFARYILVVDDYLNWREILKQRIRATFPQFQVRDAEDGREALGILSDPDYGRCVLIVTDFQMPVMGGTELARRLRETKQILIPPIILFTVSTFNEGEREEVKRRFGLAAFADKYSTDKLVLIMKELLVQRILLVDEDDALFRTFYRNILDGFNFDYARKEEAENLLRERFYSLAIVKWGDGGLIGKDIVRRIRMHDVHIPILVHSGGADYREAIDAGASEFLLEPFQIFDFTKRVSEIMGQNSLILSSIRT